MLCCMLHVPDTHRQKVRQKFNYRLMIDGTTARFSQNKKNVVEEKRNI